MLRQFVTLTSEWVQFLGGVSPRAACLEKPQKLWLLFPFSVSPQGWLTAEQVFPLTKEKLWQMRGGAILGSDLSACNNSSLAVPFLGILTFIYQLLLLMRTGLPN